MAAKDDRDDLEQLRQQNNVGGDRHQHQHRDAVWCFDEQQPVADPYESWRCMGDHHSFLQMESILDSDHGSKPPVILDGYWGTGPWDDAIMVSTSHHQQQNGFYDQSHQQQQQDKIQDQGSSPSSPTSAAVRKNCLVRKRRSGPSLKVAPPPPTTGCAVGSNEHLTHDPVENLNLKFLLQKQLKPSDVGNLGRIVLPKKEAEAQLPYLPAREGIMLAMEDMTLRRTWHLRFRFWPNNKSRMYLLENTGEFTRTHRLCEGDYLLLYKDLTAERYVIHGKKDDCHAIKRSRSLDSERRKPATATLTTSLSESAIVLSSVAAEVNVEEPLETVILEQFPLLDTGELRIDEVLDLIDLPQN